MICWGVPRTFPSGPELSNTRLTMLPIERLRLFFDRERVFEDLIRCVFQPFLALAGPPVAPNASVEMTVRTRSILANGEGD